MNNNNLEIFKLLIEYSIKIYIYIINIYIINKISIKDIIYKINKFL